MVEVKVKDRVREFIDLLADYLVGNEAEMSIRLEMGKEEAKTWQKLRNATPLCGYYPDKDKAVKELTRFFLEMVEERKSTVLPDIDEKIVSAFSYLSGLYDCDNPNPTQARQTIEAVVKELGLEKEFQAVLNYCRGLKGD